MRLWLDDIREIPDDFDHWAKTAQEAIHAMVYYRITHISFDHDLGHDTKTGYTVAKWIEMQAFNGWLAPITWQIHSANPVGRKNIQAAMEAADRYWSRHEHL